MTLIATLPYITLTGHQTPLTSAGETTDYAGARDIKKRPQSSPKQQINAPIK